MFILPQDFEFFLILYPFIYFLGWGGPKYLLSAVTDTVLLHKVAFELKRTVYKNLHLVQKQMAV